MAVSSVVVLVAVEFTVVAESPFDVVLQDDENDKQDVSTGRRRRWLDFEKIFSIPPG